MCESEVSQGRKASNNNKKSSLWMARWRPLFFTCALSYAAAALALSHTTSSLDTIYITDTFLVLDGTRWY